MNEAKAQLDAGNLGGAIEAAIQMVKSRPTDAQARTFLFELSLFAGDLERAERQLEAIGHQDVNAMIGAKIYQQCVEAERKRARFAMAQAPRGLRVVAGRRAMLRKRHRTRGPAGPLLRSRTRLG